MKRKFLELLDDKAELLEANTGAEQEIENGTFRYDGKEVKICNGVPLFF